MDKVNENYLADTLEEDMDVERNKKDIDALISDQPVTVTQANELPNEPYKEGD